MAASTSTAADSTNNNRYDVFISHRGPDVKKTFASHLYRRLKSHGLQVFLDYEELQGGEELTDQIKGAIRTASVHVAIFSPNYADSKWCLDELVFMFESLAPIIPVFHHVNPADLRWTQGEGEGVYARSLRNLKKKRAYDSQPRYDSKTIENWRNALSSAADISGLDLKAFDGDEGELLEKVVDVVFKKGVKIPLNVATYPTGMDEKVEEFEKKVLSQHESGRVQLVGITGFGGVGKTTLAKELFNRKRVDYCKSYFLLDVRENAKNSLHSLQSKLLKGLLQRDMPVDNKDIGIEMLRKHLSSFEVLLVLDDVDNVDQVKALLPVDVLHPDSLILITSRDKSILTRSGVQESSIYKLTGLNTELSRKLFCSHAFCQPHPLSGFEYLVNQFLKACDGLPLSLKVFGGLLYGNTDKSCWKDELKRLKQILPDEIQKQLKISYDALPIDEQQMFLDIACFFIGKNKDTVIRIWDGSGWNGARGFRSLLNKCLVEVDINGFNSRYQRTENCIRMHDHLRDLGRALANDKDSGLPCRRWRGKKDMDDFLQQSYETTKVRGIRYDRGWDADDDDERGSLSRYKMKNLQLLDTDIKEDLLKCLLEGVDSPELLWFRWRNCFCSSLPPCIPMKKLRVLEVDGYNLETLWPEELQAPLRLRELRIRPCRELLKIPKSLLKIPKSIGQLKSLERMEVSVLWSGEGEYEIPKEFCDLRSLKHLTLHLPKMRSLPDSFGNLSTLEHIDLSGSTNLERLPESFGNLIKLKYLDLKDCYNLTHSSGTFGKISTLEYIDLTGCHKIEVLPFQILHQGSREELCLELQNLKEWSSAIEESCPLVMLVLKTPSLETLPPSLGRYLKNLKHLKLRGCRSLKRLPDSFLLLNQLTEWIVEDCSLQELRFNTLSTESKGEKRLSNLDSSFDKCLPRLKHLRLFKTKISKISFPTGICPNIQHLQIQSCNDLVEVGTLPTALVNLDVTDCLRLRKIKGFCDISELQKLSTRRCEEELPSIETLVSLEESQLLECVKLKNIQRLRQLTQLRELYVSGCSELEEIPGLEQVMSLEKLSAYDCVKLRSIRCSAQLSQLRELEVYGCSELEEIPGLEQVMSLKKLSARHCVKLRSIRCSAQLSQLRELDVYACSELEELPDFEHLRSLEKLSVYECVKLKSLRCSAQLLQLRELNVYGCSELEEIPGLEQVMSLEKLWASKCVKLRSIRCSAQLSQLRELYVSGCSELEELPGFEHLRSLEKLSAYECVKLKSLRCSAQLLQLRELYVYGCSELEEIPGLEQVMSLKKLSACKCVKLRSIRCSAQLSQLRELYVYGCSELEELPGFEHLRSLEKLSAYECVKLKSLRCSAQLLQLRELNVYGCSELEEIPGIEQVMSLEKLWASKCVKLRSIRCSAQLSQIRELYVYGCSELEELPGFEHLRSLEKLSAYECVKLKSLRCSAQLLHLRELYVYGCSELEEIPGLEQVMSLEKLSAFKCVKLRSIRCSAQLSQLRELYVYGCSELEELPGFEHLRSLEKLSAYECVKLKSLRCSAQLLQLRELNVYGCSELEEIPGLEQVMSLEKLWASKCVKLRSIRCSAQLSQLRELYVYGCSELEELPGFEHLRSLEKLSAYECVKLKSLRCSAQLLQLRELNVYGCSELEEIPGLEQVMSLEKLWASKCVKLRSIRCSAQLSQLRELYVYGCSELEELPGFEHLRSLEKLSAYECVKLKSLRCSAQLLQLRKLYVYGCSELEEIPGLEQVMSLEKLSAFKCVKLRSIRCSAQLSQLRELYVYGCSELEELPGFEHLRSLEKLSAYECVKLKSLRCSAQLLQLRELNVYGCSELEEIPGLEQVMSLEKLWAYKCVKLRSIRCLAVAASRTIR